MRIKILMIILYIMFNESLGNGIEKKCQALNIGDSSCRLYFTCYPEKSNLTKVDIFLEKVNSLDSIFTENLNISNLILNNCKLDANISKNLFEKVESVENFSLRNVENYMELLNSSYLANKIIGLKVSSIKIMQVDQILKIVDNLGIKKIDLSDIQANYLSINLIGLENIKELGIHSGHISHLKIFLSKNLSLLNLFQNSILKLDFLNSNFSQLKTLNLNFNSVEKIKGLKLPHLTNIYLSFNKLEECFFLEKVTSLKNIELISNKLRSSVFRFEKSEFLFLNMNFLDETSVFSHMTHLKILNLKSNIFKKFTNKNLINTTNIENIDLMDNLLECFNLNLPSLKKLYLNHNFLKIFYITQELVFLDLYGNTLESFSFKKIASLYLASNEIKNLTDENLQNLTNVTTLNLSLNLIEFVEFPFSEFIKSLTLFSNKLKLVNRTFFRNLVNLEELNLNSNLIEFIESDSFIFNSRLKKLILSDNKFYTFPELNQFKSLEYIGFFYQPNLDYLDKIKISSEKRVSLDLRFNDLRRFPTRFFCLNSSNYEFYFSRIDKMDRCTLKQLSNKPNISLKVEKADCKTQQLAKKYKINLTINSIDYNCTRFKDEYCNADIFDCSKDIFKFEKTYLSGIIDPSISNILTTTNKLKIYFERKINLNRLNIEINLPKLNKFCLNTSNILKFKKELIKHFELVLLPNMTYFIFDPQSKIFLFLTPLNSFSYSIVRIKRHFLPKFFAMQKNFTIIGQTINELIDYLPELDLDAEKNEFSIYDMNYFKNFYNKPLTGSEFNSVLKLDPKSYLKIPFIILLVFLSQ